MCERVCTCKCVSVCACSCMCVCTCTSVCILVCALPLSFPSKISQSFDSCSINWLTPFFLLFFSSPPPPNTHCNQVQETQHNKNVLNDMLWEHWAYHCFVSKLCLIFVCLFNQIVRKHVRLLMSFVFPISWFLLVGLWAQFIWCSVLYLLLRTRFLLWAKQIWSLPYPFTLPHPWCCLKKKKKRLEHH